MGLMPGSRVLVFDSELFVNDNATPLSVTMKPATVLCRYGYKSDHYTYPDVIDVEFDHKPGRISKAHLTAMSREFECKTKK